MNEPKIVYEVKEEELRSAISSELKLLTENSAFAKFEERIVGVNTIADIHGISRDTVIRYIKDGLISPLNEVGHYKFKLSEVLKMDFKKMKRRLKLRV